MKTLLWVVFGILALGLLATAKTLVNNPKVTVGQFVWVMFMNLFCDVVIFLAALNW